MVSTPSLKIEGDALVIRAWLRSTRRIALDRIRRIGSVKRDLVTFEQNYLLLELDDGEQASLGELDRGFPAVEEKLRERFSPFNPGWKAVLEGGPAGVRHLIWERTQPV